MQINTFLTWEGIATFAGACTATAIITQGVKALADRFSWRLSARCISYCTSLLLLCGATFFSGVFELEAYVLCFVNAAAVALASNGGYDLAHKVTQESEEEYEDNS